MPARAFLLRYQEFCETDGAEVIRCGTRTGTKQLGEKNPDQDFMSSWLFSLPRASYAPVPPILGTGTKTRVKVEQPDHNYAEDQLNVLPRQSVLPAAKTKTATFVKAEADDKDRIGSLRAIPRCS